METYDATRAVRRVAAKSRALWRDMDDAVWGAPEPTASPFSEGDRVVMPNGTRGRVWSVKGETVEVVYRSRSGKSNMMWTGPALALEGLEEG